MKQFKHSKILDLLNKDIFLGLIVILFMGYYLWNDYITSKQLYDHGYWTSGTVVGIGTGLKGSSTFRYQFYVNGKMYNDNASAVGIRPGALHQFVGRSFPLIYYSENPSLNNILTSPAGFARFDMEIPDSLLWILRCMEK